MTQLEKLIEKLRHARGDSSFADVQRLLEANEWRQTGGRGSHVVFKRRGEKSLTIPTVSGRRVRRVYVTEALRRLGIEE